MQFKKLEKLSDGSKIQKQINIKERYNERVEKWALTAIRGKVASFAGGDKSKKGVT